MTEFRYSPDPDLKVHKEPAIRFLCRPFQSHENGLPEWVKNAADAYAREDADEDRRTVILIFSQGGRGRSSSISCLDFSGMTSRMIEDNFRQWADPEAARRDAKTDKVQGGHGNGGKCYMTQMFSEYSQIHTIKAGKGNRYGVAGGSVNFGYVPDRATGRDFLVKDLRADLEEELKAVGCSLTPVTRVAAPAIAKADGFTLVTGAGPKGYEKKTTVLMTKLAEGLEDHPQMVWNLEFCRVYVVINGKLAKRGRPLSLPEIKPIKGAEKSRIIAIPAELKDPQTGEEVSTVDGGKLPLGILTLMTSDKNMRYRKGQRHLVIFRAPDYIGSVPVPTLDIQSSYRNHLYGECRLEALAPFKQNERGPLATSPLTRAVLAFISREMQTYAKEFEARDRRQYNQKEKDALRRMNEALDRWKNRFMNEMMQGLWGQGEGTGKKGRTVLPGGKAAKIEVDLSHQKAGLGVAFRPTVKFYDKKGDRIRSVPFTWVSEDNNVAMVDEALMIVNTFAFGRTEIYAETLDRKLRSNRVSLDVVRILNIDLLPGELEVLAGSRSKLDAICEMENGDKTADVYLEWTENTPHIARVSSSGLVFGFAPGQTEVVAGDDHCQASRPALVRVVAGEGRGKGGTRGRGYPRILISDVDPDPETNELVSFRSDEPPVCQNPKDVDRNIWWINSSAPLARMYLNADRGYGHDSRAWRMYHLERYIDVLVQVAFTHGPEEKQSLSVDEWIIEWGCPAPLGSVQERC